MLKLAAVALSIIIYHAHHVHGVHGGTAANNSPVLSPLAAFQFSYCKCRSRSKPSTSSRLEYSSEEGGIHNWLHQSSFSDNVLLETDSDSGFGANTWGEIKADDEDVSIIDDWTNDAVTRRKRRLQSLERFNRATSQSIASASGEEPSVEKSGTRNNLELPYNDLSQLQVIQSNAPAILLPSGPGTGKSHVLSLRIAYLLQKFLKCKRDGVLLEDSCSPDSIVIMSFTSRDADRLKERALDYLFSQDEDAHVWKNETSRQLWSGTMHAFSLAILHKYGPCSSPMRVLPAKEMRNRVLASLRTLLNPRVGEKATEKRALQSRHLQALNDVGQSRSILYQNIVRCIDLWKESLILLTTSELFLSDSLQGRAQEEHSVQENHRDYLQRELGVRKACMELAKRLGIPKSSALLALDILPEYQARHAAAGTEDPSGLAGMAYRLLLDQPKSLHSLRCKLKHIIVDEYQDMSVSQHALLRLVVRGIVDEDKSKMAGAARTKRQSNQRRRRKLPVLLEPSDHKRRFRASSRSVLRQGYSIPSIFCAGDASQSIYGWRGGAPELTLHGFRRDYPQGIVAPLGTCYRLPNDIIAAAEMLLPIETDGEVEIEDSESLSYDVSPAAAVKAASWIKKSLASIFSGVSKPVIFRRPSEGHSIRLGNKLLLAKGMQKLDSTVTIHGLWDYREEAKYIASTIRRRSKERRKALLNALTNLDNDVSLTSDEEILDVTDVAVMVRSSKQLHIIKEALENAGIPFVNSEGKDADAHTKKEGSQSWLLQKRSRPSSKQCIPIKPVTIMTMHRSKGEEFDDCYLVGWTEGDFPHPEAVSSNRVHEERRLAYVAMTRARQRVTITHSKTKRVLHYGRNGRKKHVTSQVQPSRFIYEIVPSKSVEDGNASNKGTRSDLPLIPSPDSDHSGTFWDRSAGVKEYVAGQNVPHFFQKSWAQPKGYVAKRADLRQFTNVDMMTPQTNDKLVDVVPTTKQRESIPQISPLEIIETGLKDIVVLRQKGASKKYVLVFKEMLASFFQIRRGSALVFQDKKRQARNGSVHAMVEEPAHELVKRPLGKCTATQLGHYLAYLILVPEKSIDYSKMTVLQLKDVLRSKGLKVSGKKAQLIERLKQT
ncbi:hypothetical protein ACHAWF_010974 [Thalassiosira exigua]